MGVGGLKKKGALMLTAVLLPLEDTVMPGGCQFPGWEQ